MDDHGLPRWVAWVQDNLLLSFLLIAEAYLLGTLMTLGWVPNIEDTGTWGYYHGLGVVLFFAAGATAAGISLRCSLKAAACFKRREWGFAWFNLLGLFMFSGSEIWASLAERSQNLRPTPADTSVLAIAGVQNSPISITVVIVAFILPFANIYYGFSQQKPQAVEIEDVETLKKRMENERIKAEYAGQIAAQRARNRRAIVAAYAGQTADKDDQVVEANPDETPDKDADNDATNTEETPDKPSAKPGALPHGYVDKAAVIMWVKNELGRALTDTEAMALIKDTDGSMRLESAQGMPWIAPSRDLKKLAKRRYPPQMIRLVKSKKGA